MSLALREKSQPLLDKNGFHNYHVGISDSKDMQVLTECGQLVVNVKGVKFSRLEPTLKEREYALELFDAFLVKHNRMLKEIIRAKTEAQNIVAVEHEGFSTPRYRSDKTEAIYSFDKRNSITFDSEGKVKIDMSFKTVKEFNAFKIPLRMSKQAKEIIDARIAMAKNSKVIQELNAELTKCAI